MGAAASVTAELLGARYSKITIAAIMIYLGVYAQVHYSLKEGLKGLPGSDTR